MQVRIEQVLLGSPPLLLCFTVSQLLAFYGTTVDRLLGSEGQLTEVLASCHQLAKRVFHEQLKRRGDQLVRSPPAPPKDLSPPQQVKAAVPKPSLSESAVLTLQLDVVKSSKPARRLSAFWEQLKGQGTSACAQRQCHCRPFTSAQQLWDNLVHQLCAWLSQPAGGQHLRSMAL